MSGIINNSDAQRGEEMATGSATVEQGIWTDLEGRLDLILAGMLFGLGASIVLPKKPETK